MRYSRFKYIVGLHKAAGAKQQTAPATVKHTGSASSGGPTRYFTDKGTTFRATEKVQPQSQPAQEQLPDGYKQWLSRDDGLYKLMQSGGQIAKRIPVVGPAVHDAGKTLLGNGVAVPTTWDGPGGWKDVLGISGRIIGNDTANYLLSVANMNSDALSGAGLGLNALYASPDAISAAYHYVTGDKDAAKQDLQFAKNIMMQENTLHNLSDALDVSGWRDDINQFFVPDMPPEMIRAKYMTTDAPLQLMFDPLALRFQVWGGNQLLGAIKASPLNALTKDQRAFMKMRELMKQFPDAKKLADPAAKAYLAAQNYGAPVQGVGVEQAKTIRDYAEQGARDYAQRSLVYSQLKREGFDREEADNIYNHIEKLYNGNQNAPEVKRLKENIAHDKLIQSARYPELRSLNVTALMDNLDKMDEFMPLSNGASRAMFLAELSNSEVLSQLNIPMSYMLDLTLRDTPAEDYAFITNTYNANKRTVQRNGKPYTIAEKPLLDIWSDVISGKYDKQR